MTRPLVEFALARERALRKAPFASARRPVSRTDLDEPDRGFTGRPQGRFGLFRGMGTAGKLGLFLSDLHGKGHTGGHTAVPAVRLGQELEDIKSGERHGPPPHWNGISRRSASGRPPPPGGGP